MATVKEAATKPAANPDNARIKKLYAALAKKALNITKDSDGDWGASNILSGYAALHGQWLMAVADARQLQTPVASRKADARYAKLVKLHNDLTRNTPEVEALEAKYEKALASSIASEKTLEKLLKTRDAARDSALKKLGIGDRKVSRG